MTLQIRACEEVTEARSSPVQVTNGEQDCDTMADHLSCVIVTVEVQSARTPPEGGWS